VVSTSTDRFDSRGIANWRDSGRRAITAGLIWNWRRNTPVPTAMRMAMTAMASRVSNLPGFLCAAVFIAVTAMVEPFIVESFN
jgi:hypothetical protein